MIPRWFEKRGTIQLLLYLLDVSEANQTAIRTAIDVTNNTLKESVIPTLLEMSLITIETKKSFPYSSKLKLTEKGKKVASHLRDAKVFTYP